MEREYNRLPCYLSCRLDYQPVLLPGRVEQTRESGGNRAYLSCEYCYQPYFYRHKMCVRETVVDRLFAMRVVDLFFEVPLVGDTPNAGPIIIQCSLA